MSELHDLTALEQGAAIRAGDVSAVELAEHYLGRIEAGNAAVGAFTVVTRPLALEELLRQIQRMMLRLDQMLREPENRE